MKRIIMFICMFALLIPSSLIMAQEESVSNTINIHLQLGEDKITINDESLTIVKPFVVNGTTLVPLRVITEAFGAELTWISATQTVILEYGETLIELSIGTKDAYVNNEIQTLLVEPVLEMGTTMVPLRFISENFGAEVKYDNLTKEIFITGTLIDSIANLFNGDEGMTHVGDSHFGWSMKYPSGLALDYQSFQGDTVFFEDANGEYDISIFVEDSKNMTQADLLKEITSYTFGTLLDRQTVNEEGRIYAKVLSKDSGGAYTEIRGFLQGKKVYYVFLEVTTEEDYKNQEKFKNYQDLLNSFVLSYDPTSKETKDITKVKAGFIDYSNEDYGLTLKIPVDWRESWSSDVSFTNYELEQSFELSMTSREKGDTLASWAQRDDEMMRALYAKEYLELGEIVQTEVSGVPAIVRIVSALFGDEWMQLYDVYFFIGDYKINVSIDYLRDDYSDFKETLQTIMQSISIDEAKLSESFGYIEDTTVYD